MKPEIEFIGEALAILCPNGAGYNGVDITPVSDSVPTQAELDAQVEIQKAKYEALQYQRDRQYPSIGDQLDLLFHDMTEGKGSKTGDWYKEIAKVKSNNPKPE